MDTFVKRFQPERFALWIEGRDIAPHPEDMAARISNAEQMAEE